MITGYNTDVRHGEVVFHVQTEDKGVSNPYIESLVYVGGQVLASKRASYAEMLAAGKQEKEIVAFMDHQHRTMIAAIRHGKLDAKLASLNASRQTGQYPAVAVENPSTGEPPVPARLGVPAPAPSPPPPQPPPAPLEAGETVARTTVTPPAPSAPSAPSVPSVPSAPPRPAKPSVPERTLDQVILEYLTSEADQEQLVLLLEEERDLALGRHATLVLRASSSKSGQPMTGTQVSVRMISTVLEPRVLASGRTDDRGLLTLGFDIPQVNRGTSALIINAVSAIGRAELKHLL
ncbi:MAG TPA: hypothetical protein VHC97_03005 [Thermoanaerobaculia bacterium]|jgi:hypothetical protein|nr:hypothetical protein [Thermoanaerobaculia bacterium]